MKITQEHDQTLNLLASSVPPISKAEFALIPIFSTTNQLKWTSMNEL